MISYYSFTWIFLLNNDAEHISMWLCTICVSYFIKWVFKYRYFVHLYWTFFLLLNNECSLYIPDTSFIFHILLQRKYWFLLKIWFKIWKFIMAHMHQEDKKGFITHIMRLSGDSRAGRPKSWLENIEMRLAWNLCVK